MIVCRRCSGRNQDADDFCGSCGAFLEWSGSRVTPEISEEARTEAEEAATAPRVPLLRRVIQGTALLANPPATGAPVQIPNGPGTTPRPPGLGTPLRPPSLGTRPPPGTGGPPSPPRTETPPRPSGPGARPPAQPGADSPTDLRRTGPVAPPGTGGAPPQGSARMAGLRMPPSSSNTDAPAATATGAGAGPGTVLPPGGRGRPAGGPRPGHLAAPERGPASRPDRDDVRHEDTIPIPTVSEAAARTRDAALIAPLPPAAPSDDEDLLDDEPDAVLPQAPQPRPARRDRLTVRSNVLRPGDLICGDCGQGNTPIRRFCARCGFELREAEIARVPWWRRFRRRHGPRVIPLGTVNGQQSEPVPFPGGGFPAVWAKVKITAGIVLCLSCMLYATYAPFRNMVNNATADLRATAKGLLESQYSPVRPAKVSASRSLRGHGAKYLVDLNSASYWSAPHNARSPDEPEKADLLVEFDRVVRLDQLIITAGAGDAFTDHGRPRQMILTFTNEKQMRLQLQDTAQQQKFSLDHATAIKTVRIEITDVYAAEKGKDVSIAELEFFSLLS